MRLIVAKALSVCRAHSKDLWLPGLIYVFVEHNSLNGWLCHVEAHIDILLPFLTKRITHSEPCNNFCQAQV